MVDSIKNYLKETQTEMKRVTWLSRAETVRFTVLVLGISIVVAVFLGSLDILFAQVLEKFIF